MKNLRDCITEGIVLEMVNVDYFQALCKLKTKDFEKVGDAIKKNSKLVFNKESDILVDDILGMMQDACDQHGDNQEMVDLYGPDWMFDYMMEICDNMGEDLDRKTMTTIVKNIEMEFKKLMKPYLKPAKSSKDVSVSDILEYINNLGKSNINKMISKLEKTKYKGITLPDEIKDSLGDIIMKCLDTKSNKEWLDRVESRKTKLSDMVYNYVVHFFDGYKDLSTIEKVTIAGKIADTFMRECKSLL